MTEYQTLHRRVGHLPTLETFNNLATAKIHADLLRADGYKVKITKIVTTKTVLEYDE